MYTYSRFSHTIQNHPQDKEGEKVQILADLHTADQESSKMAYANPVYSGVTEVVPNSSSSSSGTGFGSEPESEVVANEMAKEEFGKPW